jgi:hypothetical protein
MMSDPSGSERRVNSEREVKTRLVSSVDPFPLFRARIEYVVNVRMGATTGVLKPASDQYGNRGEKRGAGSILKSIFHTKIFLNFFEIRSSFTRKP